LQIPAFVHVETVLINQLMLLKVALLRKKAKLKRGCGLNFVTVCDAVSGCKANTGGAEGGGAVVEVVFAAGVDVLAFFAYLFLLEGAGIDFAG
jgi:hypothetical protein